LRSGQQDTVPHCLRLKIADCPVLAQIAGPNNMQRLVLCLVHLLYCADQLRPAGADRPMKQDEKAVAGLFHFEESKGRFALLATSLVLEP
jgi:hypothetical protein